MIKKIFRDQHDAWVAIQLGARFSTRMVTIGLLVHYLSTQEVAAWYVFMAVFGLAALAEAGFGRVVTRQVAERFKAKSCQVCKRSDLVFLTTILKFYFVMLVVLCIFAFLLGIWWFEGHLQAESVPWLTTAWILFVLANGVSLYSALNAAILNGLGEVGTSQKNESFASLVNMAVFIGAAVVSASLLAPAIALVSSTVVSMSLNRRSLRRLVKGLNGFERCFSVYYMKVISVRIGPELGKYFFMLLAFHLLTSAFVLMLNHYEEASVVASYGITMQLLTLVLTFSSIWLTSSFPIMAAQKGNNGSAILKQQFYSVAVRGIGVLLVGMLSIAFIGNALLDVIGSRILLLPMEILQILMVVIAVEYIIFTLLGQLLVSQSLMRFTNYSVIGSIAISLVALSLLELGYGITAMFIGRIIIFMLVIAFPIIQDTRRLFSPRVKGLA